LDAAHFIQEILRAWNATREAQESEYRRRVAWEQEFETKYQQRQAETEAQLAEVKREIAYLKACVASLQAGGSVYPHEEPGSSPVVHLGATSEGSSRQSAIIERMSIDAPSPSASSMSPNGNGLTPSPDDREYDSGDSESEASQSPTELQPQKRTNNHDKRCYTIQVV